MIRSTKLAALTVALAVLGFGSGCGLFDEYCEDCNSGDARYQQDGLPAPRDAGTFEPSGLPPTTSPPSSPAPAGVYPSGNQ